MYASLQVKEMEAIKYSDSSMQGYDIGWNAAAEVWIKEFADEFRLGHDKEHRAPKEVIDKFNQHLQRCYPPRCVAA